MKDTAKNAKAAKVPGDARSSARTTSSAAGALIQAKAKTPSAVSAGTPKTTAVRDGASGRFVAVIEKRLPTQQLEALESQYGSMEAVVDYLLTSLPTVNVLDEKVGPFRDTTNMQKFLGLTRQGVDQRVTAGTLLCVRSSDGHRMFPDFQFDKNRQSLPHLREVLDALHSDRKNAWGAALWLAQPDDDLGGRTPADVLRDGADIAVVLQLAMQAGMLFAA